MKNIIAAVIIAAGIVGAAFVVRHPSRGGKQCVGRSWVVSGWTVSLRAEDGSWSTTATAQADTKYRLWVTDRAIILKPLGESKDFRVFSFAHLSTFDADYVGDGPLPSLPAE